MKRRRVVRVAVAYTIAAVAVGGAADVFLPGLGAPTWTLQTVLALLVLGLPLATALSWAYDITPEGVVRHPVSPGSDAPASTVVESRSTDLGAANRPRSIVVLPFDNMSPDPGDEYFSDGLTEEIITQLAHLRPLRVISRSSAMALKKTNKDVRQIGRELGGEYALEGSVRKASNDLRITVQLIDAVTDEHLWAQSYDRELKDVFDIQSVFLLGRVGRVEDLAHEVAKLETRADEGLVTWTEVATAYMGVDDHERAVELLAKAVDQRPPPNNWTAWMGAVPIFEPLRADDRFQEVLSRIGLG